MVSCGIDEAAVVWLIRLSDGSSLPAIPRAVLISVCTLLHMYTSDDQKCSDNR